ncbi:MAG: lasso peptide biosynthesis B2 protein [Dokdonella sp.]|nr:lasso peptide biosynthesis B2 protein [Dokdonella sp.]
MSYGLRDDLSYCRADGRLIFLDVEQDRYFRLSDAMEQTLVAFLEGDAGGGVDIGPLIEANILTPAQPETAGSVSPAIELPRRSLVERRPPPRKIAASVLIDAFTIVCTTQWRLKRRKLKQVLDALVAYRQQHTPQTIKTSNGVRQPGLMETVDDFRRVRRYVPIEPICLLDSLAMTRFLAKRGLNASIVFGVTTDPFSAHCWVQTGDLVLNDTVGHTSAYVPIRVV